MKIDKIGIEVELAVFKLGKPVVCSFLPYDKKNPLNVDGNLLHKDASMYEIALKPCSTGEQIEEEWARAVAHATSMLPPDCVFRMQAAANYSDEELALDPYASVLGCSSSRSIYNDPRPMPTAYPSNQRYAGMHISISADTPILNRQVIALDAVLGLYSTAYLEIAEGNLGDSLSRRKLYGRAGEYRRKPFGIEYRTLPASSWSRMTGPFIFSMVDKALNLDVDKLIPHANNIQEVINNVYPSRARSLIDQLDLGV